MKTTKLDLKADRLDSRLSRTIGACLMAGVIIILGGASSAWASSGTWTNKTDSVWSATTNWNAGVVADGGDNLADFSTISGVTTLNVTLDSPPRTLGNLKFGGATTEYLIGANTLTLQNSTNIPTVTGTANTLVIGAPLASSQQVLITGGIVSLTNDLNSLTGGLIYQNNPFGFTTQNALGSGTIQIGNAVGGNNIGGGQCGFDALSSATAGTAPVTLANNFVIRTFRWITGQQAIAGLNPQPVIINGNVTLDMGNGNVRDVYPLQPLTINGVLSGGQPGAAAAYGLILNGNAPLTLTSLANTFVGNINFGAANTLGVNGAGALGYYQNRINFNIAGGSLRIDAPFTIPNYQGPGGIGVNVAANATITNSVGNDLQIDAIIMGTATLTKSGAGKVTLTAANTFSGPLSVNGGTLAITGSGSVASAGAATVATNAIFLLADSASVANLSTVTVNNGGQFVLQGSPTLKGTVAITANAGGTVDVSGLSSTFTLASGGTLIGSGVVTGSLVAASGSVIVPGTVGTAGTLTLTNDLALNGQAITFDLRNNTTEGSTTNDEIVVAGNLTLNGGEKIYLNYLDGQLAAGTYKLIAYGVSKTGNFTLGAAYPNVTLDNTGTPGYVTLIVSAPSIANNLTWKGDGTVNAWDVNTTANWVTNWANPSLVYTDPSKVNFDDNGSNSPNINLTATVLPNAVTFSNNIKAYTVSGTGKISGGASLNLVGSGSVTFATANDFSGGTTFSSSGTLRIGNGGAVGAVGSGAITMGSASPKVYSVLSTPLTLASVSGSGGTPQIYQNGTGTTTLSGTTDNSFLGAVVNAGTLVLAKASSGTVHALGAATTVNTGGTLQLAGSGGSEISGAVPVTLAGGTLDANGQSDTFKTLNGYGTVTDTLGGGVLTLTNPTGMTVSGGTMNANASITFSGAGPGFLVQSGGTLNLQGGTDTYTASTTTSALQGGGVFNMSGGSLSTATYIAFGSATGTAVANFSGGTFNNLTGEFLQCYQGASLVTVSSGATLNCHYWSYGDRFSGTNYFNGGLTKLDAFHNRSTLAWAGYFNGGTIQAKSTPPQSKFLPDTTTTSTANQHAYVSTNGLIIDCQSFNIGISQNLEHDTSLGAGLDGGLTKLGAGTLTLTGTNSFNGSISNLNGVLAFNNAGSYNNVVIGDNATNQVNIAAAGTSLTNNTLTIGTTGSGTQGLNFNLGTSGNPSVPIIVVNGVVTNSGNVVLSLLAPTLTPGTIPLMQYGSMDAANFASTWSMNPFPYVSLTLTNDTVHKLVSVVVVPGVTPKWKGDVSTAWDTSTLNWRSNSVAVAYLEPTPPGQPVTFDDTATSFTVDISTATVNPLFISMTNNNSYTFNGTLGIGGTGALFKSGTGSLVLNNASGANTYSGITTVNGGSVVVDAANLLSPNSAMTFNNSTLNLGTYNQAFKGLTLNNALVSGNCTLTGSSSSLTVNNSTNFTLGTTLAGSIGLSVTGTGEMTLTNSNTYTGDTTIFSGSVRVQNGGALGAGLFVGGTATQVQPGGRVVLDGSFAIPESINMNGTGPDGVGCLIVTNGNVVENGSPCQLMTPSTIYVAAGSSITFLGQINGNATTLYGSALTKSGPGTLQVGGTNANTFTPSSAVVAQGTLICSNTVNSGTITVNGGAALQGSGTFQAGVYVAAGATLTPDINNYIGTLTSASGLTNAGAMTLQLLKTGSTTNADRIACTGVFANTGTLTVITNVGTTLPLAAGDSFKLFTLTNYSVLSGLVPTLPALPTGLAWTNNLAVNGTIVVYATVSTTPFNIATSVSGTNLTLQWPSDHIGWRLLVQTNHLAEGLSTNMSDWGVYPNSSNVDQVVIPLDPAKVSEFYRMVYP